MRNEYNPDGKEIRFIDSSYKDLFRIPDGGCIQVQYPDETVIKPCKFLDEYHTQIGYNVFHICQFAEVMERNGAVYTAEPEILGDEAAWKVGRDRILALQTCEDGYDYTLFDENYNEIDGGQLDNPELSMTEARKEILESFQLEHRELRVMVYDDVMEQALEAERQAVAVREPEKPVKWDDVHGKFTPDESMTAFLERTTNAYAVLQIRRSEEAPQRLFMNYAYLQKKGMEPEIDHYHVVYHDALGSNPDVNRVLEALYTKFNIDRPDDFLGHSMSVSDIVALKVDGEVSCYYVDSIGFVKLKDFIQPENYLKNAEMALEDDYGMLDGVINNGKNPAKAERPSILEKLKEMSVSDTPHKPARSHPERDMG